MNLFASFFIEVKSQCGEIRWTKRAAKRGVKFGDAISGVLGSFPFLPHFANAVFLPPTTANKNHVRPLQGATLRARSKQAFVDHDGAKPIHIFPQSFGF